MNHVKNNWVVGEVFHASDLNNIARTINALIDKQESLINDNEASDSSVFSSEKINEAVEERMTAVINDEEASGNTTYSSSKTEEKIEEAKLKTVVARELPLVGEENTIYATLKVGEDESPKITMSYPLVIKNGKIEIHKLEDDHDVISGFSIGDVFKYTESGYTEQPPCLITNVDEESLRVIIDANAKDGSINNSVFNGVTAVTLQDGHYYRLKDEVVLEGKQFGGNFAFFTFAFGGAFVLPIFEEVSNPSRVDYEDIPYIPGIFMIQPYSSLIFSKFGIAGYRRNNTYYESEQFNFELPDLQIGQIVKVVGENIGYDGNDFLVVTEFADTDSESISGIVSTSVWRKNEYYRFTGYHNYGGESEHNGARIKNMVLTFEKITGEVTADYEVPLMPMFAYAINSILEKHMWIEDEKEFEYIGIA